MVSLMKQYKRLFIYETLLILFLFFLPCFMMANGFSSETKPLMKQSQWVPPDPDNLYYTESLNIDVLKDGSVSKEWNLVDHGIGNITFPINLTTPVNESSLALEDLRVRLGISQHEQYSYSWGPITFQTQYTEFMFEDNFESIVSHIYVEFYALIDDEDNQSLVFSLLDDYITELESLWNGVSFFKFEESSDDPDNRRLLQRWRAIPSDQMLETVFEYLLDNCLPTNMGLFKIDENSFLKSEHKSIHIAANWDGHNESGSDTYDQEPTPPGGSPTWDADFDDRWEFIAGIYEYNSKAINILENSENTLNLKDIIPFTISLPSHPNANSSIIVIDLYHGSKLVGAKPNFLGSEKIRSRYTIDMIDDSGEGSNYELQVDSYITFNDGIEAVPSVLVTTSVDNPVVAINQNFTITYNVTNTGLTTIYDVSLTDDIDDIIPANSTIFEGDSADGDDDIDTNWQTIGAGVSVTHHAKIGINETGRWYADPTVFYHTSTYAAIDEWNRNPNNYYGGYEVDGQQAFIVCNDTEPILTLAVELPQTSFVIGEEVNIQMILKNVGNANATDIDWYSPIMGINTTSATGTIETIKPNDTVIVNTSFIVDHPSRYDGYFIDSSFGSNYQGASLNYWYNGHTSWSGYEYTNEIPKNIFPRTNQVFGALVVLQKEQSKITMDGIEYLEVIIHVKNAGDTTAYNVDVSDQYPAQNFTFLSGSPTNTNWDYLPSGVEYTYSYIVKYPIGVSLDTQVSLLTVNYDIVYSWDTGYSCEETFDFKASSTGSPLNDLLGILPILGFSVSTIAAVALGYLLLKEKGMVGRY